MLKQTINPQPMVSRHSRHEIQLGQLRLNPPGLGSKCSKQVERFSDFGKYKGNCRNHPTSLPTPRTLSKWGKWVDRLSDFGKYKGYIRNHSTSLPAYRTLSQVRGGSTSADLAVFSSCIYYVHYAQCAIWRGYIRRFPLQSWFD